MYIIGDVAGQYETLIALVAKLPPNEDIILAGDLPDRGPDSNKVIQWAIDNAPRVRAVKGNHDDMMVDFCTGTLDYHPSDWLDNGGDKTLQSYLGRKVYVNKPSLLEQAINAVPIEHIEYLNNLPLSIEENGLLVTHAPYTSKARTKMDKLWNRHDVEIKPGCFNIFGHNSYWGLTLGEQFACIDTSGSNVLTAMHWPSKKIIQQEYIK